MPLLHGLAEQPDRLGALIAWVTYGLEYQFCLAGGERETPNTRNAMIAAVVRKVRRFLRCEKGPTAVEYAVLLMLVFLVVLASIQILGGSAKRSLQDSSDKIDAAVSGKS